MVLRLLRETVWNNPFIPKQIEGFAFPSRPQARFLTHPAREIMYGGAAGGGKTVALLASALQYVTVPGYSAILFRRTITDLEQTRGLIPTSHEWLMGKADWNGSTHQWLFPSGATLSFGYLKDAKDHFRYKGVPFQFVGFDELTTFGEIPYRFLFGRLRKPPTMNVPLRMRSCTNPGDQGHEWVKRRFIQSDRPEIERLFIPARLEDNPGIDRQSYEQMLAELDPVTRAQMRKGDWDIRPEGNLFKRQWFDVVDGVPSSARTVRAWDLAATEPEPGKDPDYIAGAKMSTDGRGAYYLEDMRRTRCTPHEVERLIHQTAKLDGIGVTIEIEEEPGSSGKLIIDHYQRSVLQGFACIGRKSTGDKVTRANPMSAACEQGRVKIVKGPWVNDFLDELCAFPVAEHDDQVDAASRAFNALSTVVTFNTGFTIGRAKS